MKRTYTHSGGRELHSKLVTRNSRQLVTSKTARWLILREYFSLSILTKLLYLSSLQPGQGINQAKSRRGLNEDNIDIC